MATKRMLIDAAHPEETRVVVLDGTRVDDFDYELANRAQLRGNIYLAKVTRVEPSLQAAFIEYGGNRHGFLAFSEIHPDYYQIPTADREALKAEEAAARSADDSDADEDESPESRNRIALRRYKIQEVIRRRQILLVQVVKEERGNKGAALTTYLSLAGRYCVLMPNTDRGGGISRKITSAADRKRLKKVAAELEVPTGMGLIIRTAGAKRTKTEVKRDYEYLTRAWDDIRERTLHSSAPALIYEESSLVKRSIRDLYDKDVEHILVEGEDAYREAKDFVKMLMPSHSKKVQQYKDGPPIFTKNKVESQLDSIYSPVVQLKSGGYIVINQTEALVAIDVNSGRSTRERSIESTAAKTNLEAADEAARQMRLRDLAGLVVIDFIDMEESKNDRAVEKRMKDALRFDRARVQMGKISGFGLLEISRQRRRTGILEGTSIPCPHCEGTGRLRSVESAALLVVRALEDAATKAKNGLEVRCCAEVAMYVLNEKRTFLAAIEERTGAPVRVTASSEYSQGSFEVHQIAMDMDHDYSDEPAPRPAQESAADAGGRRGRGRRPAREEEPREELEVEDDVAADEDEDIEEELDQDEAGERRASDEDDADRKGRRRRRGRRGGRRRREDEGSTASGLDVVDPVGGTLQASDGETRDDRGNRRKRRRRGRGRGGFDGGEHLDFVTVMPIMAETEADSPEADSEESKPVAAAEAATEAAEKSPRGRTRRPKAAAAAPVADGASVTPPPAASAAAPEDDGPPKFIAVPELGTPADIMVERTVVTPKATPSAPPPRPVSNEVQETPVVIAVPDLDTGAAPVVEGSGDGDAKPKRRGWWGGLK
jgi:ribonuclease E